MRYAFISDIHSNIEALDAALAFIAPEDTVVCLGDIIGYGPNPNECIARVRERSQYVVLGNHDLAVLNGFGVDRFNDAARAAVAWTRDVLDPEHLAWIDTLAYELRLPEMLFVHGAPVDYFEYILDVREAATAFAATDAPVVFIGHTHIPELWTLDAEGAYGHIHVQHGGTHRLDIAAGNRYIVDVGSVGQPRDLNPEGSIAIYDDIRKDVEWVRFEYDIGKTQSKIRAVGLPGYLAMRLGSGR